MAEKKQSKFEEFAQKYGDVFSYENFFESHPDGNGDLEELTAFFASQMKKRGVKDEHIAEVIPTLREKYMNGDRSSFLQPGIDNYGNTLNNYKKYVGDNLEAIIDSTDDKILREVVLPQVLEKYKTDKPEYENLEKLLKKEKNLRKELEGLQNPETRKDVINGYLKKKEEEYKEQYPEDKLVQEVLVSLYTEGRVIETIRGGYEKNREELDKALDKDIKGYIRSVGLKAEDIVNVYSPLFKKSYQESGKKK